MRIIYSFLLALLALGANAQTAVNNFPQKLPDSLRLGVIGGLYVQFDSGTVAPKPQTLMVYWTGKNDASLALAKAYVDSAAMLANAHVILVSPLPVESLEKLAKENGFTNRHLHCTQDIEQKLATHFGLHNTDFVVLLQDSRVLRLWQGQLPVLAALKL